MFLSHLKYVEVVYLLNKIEIFLQGLVICFSFNVNIKTNNVIVFLLFQCLPVSISGISSILNWKLKNVPNKSISFDKFKTHFA